MTINQMESPINSDFLNETNIKNFKKIADYFGRPDSDLLSKQAVKSICQLAWTQNDERLHALGVNRSWLRMFVSKLFCGRRNLPAGDWTIEQALKI